LKDWKFPFQPEEQKFLSLPVKKDAPPMVANPYAPAKQASAAPDGNKGGSASMALKGTSAGGK